MTTIINTTDLQRMGGTITKNIKKTNYVVTNKGRGSLRILPYFDGSDEFLEDYLEAFLIKQNEEKLKKEMEDSLASGKSDLVI